MRTEIEEDTQAVVVGGSFAGLLSARVLSNHFDRVTVLERDPIQDHPESRRGQPQTRHVHGVLPSGLKILNGYFPDLADTLEEHGATFNDIARSIRWFNGGGYWQQYDSGLEIVLVGRPFMEWQIRQRVEALPNVTVQGNSKATGLLASEDRSRVKGISYTDETGEHSIDADLVVVASGRHSLSLRWLEELGFDRPPEETVDIGLTYTSRIFKRSPGDLIDADAVLVTPDPPSDLRLGGLFPMEHDRWIVSLAGWGGDSAPLDDEGFARFVESLPAPDIHNVLKTLEPIGEAFTHKFPTSQRRRFEKLPDFPEGMLALGDAICSFNPVYGQGMTSSLKQAKVLDEELSNRQSPDEPIWRSYFKRVDRVVDIPWQLATGADFAFDTTSGPKPPGTDLINQYIAQLQRTAHHDEKVLDAFLQVMNLDASPPSLLKPMTAARVARSWGKRQLQRSG